ncbi:MAG TPA: COX15/CtaA family protein [Steroidobacteraceae bacterium]|nr:COX15/CtaA family protein [Steroidobacteraceae bacterium]
MPAARLIRSLALAGFVLCFIVVVLGAYVRLTAAGLGCPDWPGCYGHVTPLGAQHSAAAQAAFAQRPLEVGKAWREMIHRYAASTLGLLIAAIASIVIVNRRVRPVSVGYALALLGIVVLQGMLGMLTVTWQLKPLIVTLHLLFGLTTLGLLWWLVLSLPRTGWGSATRSRRQASAAITAATVSGLIALVIQIALGGWTSSNYAAIACPDFPTCQNQWWPVTDFRDAFVLWHGLWVNYEGGILENPARVAIHLTHRLGAVVATLTLCAVAVTILASSSLRALRPRAIAVLAALALQLAIGISMVIKGFPLWLATAHTAGAAVLLLSVMALLHALRRAPGASAF